MPLFYTSGLMLRDRAGEVLAHPHLWAHLPRFLACAHSVGVLPMRVDPEGIYLELLPGALWMSLQHREEKRRDAVRLHFKLDPQPGTKWSKVVFMDEDGEGLGPLLQRIGDYIDQKGLDTLLEECAGMRKDAA